jgi:glyoxylase-like metal-dependent hydrolase (beta-lactamase superfamily II)
VPDLDLLDAGVYCWLQEPGRLGVTNAGVVVDADGITVIDTLMVPDQWQPFGDAVDALGMPVRRVVLTSSLIEFVGGTPRFNLGAVYARRQVSVQLDQPPNVESYRALMPEFADGFDDELITRPVSHIVADDVQLTPAITLLTTAGQMEENVVALVSGAGLLFAGAMCAFGATPLCFQGDLALWADELDRIVDLAPVIIPGHGPIGGEEEVRDLQAYLRACVAAEGDAGAIPGGPWDEWTDRHHDEVNVERAAMLARGDTSIPPTMLRAAGLA